MAIELPRSPFAPPDPDSEPKDFCPGPRYVYSTHAFELSWTFEALRDAFYAERRIDHFSKFEFFGRLGNAANRCLRETASAAAQQVCAAVLHEAFAIYDDTNEGVFGNLAAAIGNEIADDYTDRSLSSGFKSLADTRKFFSQRGIEFELV